MVHDPRNSLREGDVVEFVDGWRASRRVRHVVERIVAPFGTSPEERPAVMNWQEREEELARARATGEVGTIKMGNIKKRILPRLEKEAEKQAAEAKEKEAFEAEQMQMRQEKRETRREMEAEKRRKELEKQRIHEEQKVIQRELNRRRARHEGREARASADEQRRTVEQEREMAAEKRQEDQAVESEVYYRVTQLAASAELKDTEEQEQGAAEGERSNEPEQQHLAEEQEVQEGETDRRPSEEERK